ncbi:tetratricopeptide repeat protein [Synechococcus elongatus]|uniref:tetratricopeptide repeat protein n=1 Tax=Synechococcus elongatus TaxID=32046 RepID=UPI000F7F2B67|nr:tetratricopeptide repeat protein [Synechococcus elongatus]
MASQVTAGSSGPVCFLTVSLRLPSARGQPVVSNFNQPRPPQRQRWVDSLLGVSLVALVVAAALPLLLPLVRLPGGSSARDRELAAAQATAFQTVLQRDPDNLSALRSLIGVYLQQQQLQAAIAPLQRLARLQPQQPAYRVLLAQTQAQLGDREAAAQTYRQILETAPTNLEALRGFTQLLLTQKQPTAAVDLLQKARQTDKITPADQVSIDLMLAQVYANQGQIDDAIALYDRSAQNNGRDFRPLLAKALLLKQQGDLQKATPIFQEAIAIAPAQYRDQIRQLSPASMPATPPTQPATKTPPTAPPPPPN